MRSPLRSFKFEVQQEFTTSEPFYSMKISVARASHLRGLIVGKLKFSHDQSKSCNEHRALFKNASLVSYTIYNDVMSMKV